MILKNNVARLITINGAMVNNQRTKSFQVRPGNNPAVDVPDELCNNKFVKGMIDNGSLIKVGESAEVESEYATMSKSDLLSLCESLEIETTSRDTVKTLSGKLDTLEAE